MLEGDLPIDMFYLIKRKSQKFRNKVTKNRLVFEI